MYQRNYEWSKEQCKKLFEDIVQAAKRNQLHFTGSIVFQPLAPIKGINNSIVIDGQQRLTTIYILIKALVDTAASDAEKAIPMAALFNTDQFNQFNLDDTTKVIVNDQMQQYEEARKKLEEMPGIGARSAQVILAEIGLDMSRFPTAGHLAAWAGLAPGNNESAGKRKSGRTRKGNPTLKTTLIQCAKTAKSKKGSFFKAQFDRLAVRRGKNRAVVAVAHSMLIAIYHMLKFDTPFTDLGENYYCQFNAEKKINHHLKQLQKLGWQCPIPA